MKQAKTLNNKQLLVFFKQLEAFKNARRNKLVVCLTFYGGLRIGEVTKLKWSDVVDANLTVKDEIVLSAADNKSNEVQRLFINKKLRAEIIEKERLYYERKAREKQNARS